MNKFWIYFSAIMVACNSLILPIIAHAETCIGGGGLSIVSLPSFSDFPTLPVSASDQTNTFSFSQSIIFQDLRGVPANFTLNVTSTDFKHLLNDTISIDLTNLKITSDNNDSIGLISCDNDLGISLTELNPSSFVDIDNDGTSDTKTLVSGDVRARIGSYSIDPELELLIPGGMVSGDYRTTLTFSIY